MKKTFLILCILAFCKICSAQNSNPWPTSGNVGIGTSSPTSLLHVNGSISSNWLKIFTNTETYGHKLYFVYGNGSDKNYGFLITGGKIFSSQLDFAVKNKFY